MSIKDETQPGTIDVTVAQALDRFMRDKKGQLRPTTLRTYKWGVKKFQEWMALEGLTLADLDAWNIGEFGNYLRDETDYSPNTVESYTKACRVFIKFLSRKNVVDFSHEAVDILTASIDERRSDSRISVGRAMEIESVMKEKYPGRRNTVMYSILLNTGCRVSGLRSLDVCDVKYQQDTGAVIRLKDRPNTRLKGGKRHNRVINIKQELFNQVQEYKKYDRIVVADDDGRKPLFTTKSGRISITSIKNVIYQMTCPKTSSVGECSCVKAPNVDEASKCDKSHGPHSLKAAHITHLKDRGWPDDAVSERCACSKKMIEIHYDTQDDFKKADRRRDLMDRL